MFCVFIKNGNQNDSKFKRKCWKKTILMTLLLTRSDTTAMKSISKEYFQNCFQGWVKHWHWCIAFQVYIYIFQRWLHSRMRHLHSNFIAKSWRTLLWNHVHIAESFDTGEQGRTYSFQKDGYKMPTKINNKGRELELFGKIKNDLASLKIYARTVSDCK